MKWRWIEVSDFKEAHQKSRNTRQKSVLDRTKLAWRCYGEILPLDQEQEPDYFYLSISSNIGLPDCFFSGTARRGAAWHGMAWKFTLLGFSFCLSPSTFCAFFVFYSSISHFQFLFFLFCVCPPCIIHTVTVDRFGWEIQSRNEMKWNEMKWIPLECLEFWMGIGTRKEKEQHWMVLCWSHKVVDLSWGWRGKEDSGAGTDCNYQYLKPKQVNSQQGHIIQSRLSVIGQEEMYKLVSEFPMGAPVRCVDQGLR